MIVIFTLENLDKSLINIEYEPFDYAHSKLWLQGIKEFLDSGNPLTDTDRLFNFNPQKQDLLTDVNKLNNLIDNINIQLVDVTIPHLRHDHLQDDVNYIHLNFVESDRGAEYTKTVDKELWYDLNGQLHGLESKFRKNYERPQGQIFVELYGTRYELPEESYQYFTIKDTFGYCYANYAHVGRHIQELYYADDHTAEDHHILPMHQISGSSRLWFGDTTPELVEGYHRYGIKKWFEENNISTRINMEWGDPHLAIGWLPVAQMVNNLTKEDLLNVSKLIKIGIK